jgi:cysteine desulfurase
MERIYLDHAATSPLRPEVERAMMEARARFPGNPASAHRWGREARARVEEARERVAELLGVDAGDVYFVRGGTESDNLAVQGRILAATEGAQAGRGPVVAARSAVEHDAVSGSAAAAARRAGGRVEVLGVAPNGCVDPEALDRLLARRDREPLAVISVQVVNAETGLVLGVEEVILRCREAGVAVHVDAVQGVGRVPLPGEAGPGPHLLSLSSHKLGGPGSAGVLVRERGVELAPVLLGGGQEGGVRPGTLDVAAVVGTAEALALTMETREEEARRLGRLRSGLERRLLEAFPDLRVHGGEGRRAPHILNIGVPGLPRDLLPGAMDLEGVGVSAGSACRSGADRPSPGLSALYGREAEGVAPLRVSLGWSTTREEVEEAGGRILDVLARVRSLS